MKTVDVNCPKSLDLKNIVKTKESASILQTVDVFDKVAITSYLRGMPGIFIKSSEELDDALKNDIKMIVDLFLKYINISVSNLEINIEKNRLNLTNNYYNILAGILIGLNIYFQNSLHKHELIYLGSTINNLIGYYIECGYKKIDIDNRYSSIGENNYYKYIILEDLKKEELLRIKNKLIEINKEHVIADFNNEYFFIALSRNLVFKYNLSNLPIKLKKEFNNVKVTITSNVNENKVLVRYLNNFE
ncbi:MAG: hypothetical protein IJ068_00075 [Bacilli bacterium]|nr:hypothetical protein [Bacilli bacterium]